MSLSSKEHPSSVSTRAVKSRTSWENGPSPATSESNRPNPMSPATSSPPKEIRARDASDAPISKRNASSSAQLGDPRRLNTLVMRVAGTPRRVASPTTRVADAPAFAPALPTTKQRSQRATTAATASPQCVEVSMKITSATLRRTMMSRSTGAPYSSARSGSISGPHRVSPGPTRIAHDSMSSSASSPSIACASMPSSP